MAKSTRQKVIDACVVVVEELRKEGGWIPYDTGNMRYNSLRYEEQADKFIIYMDEEQAPYVPFTNEPWISPKWNGKKNPNEGWWERFTAEFTRRLANRLNGEVKEE